MAIGFCEICNSSVKLPHYKHMGDSRNMKKIVFMVMDTGVDGRQKPHPIYASYSEIERDEWFDDDANSAYYTKTEKIVEVDGAKIQAEAKLDAVDKLMLNIWQKMPKRRESK